MTRVMNSTGNRARADSKKQESAHQQVLKKSAKFVVQANIHVKSVQFSRFQNFWKICGLSNRFDHINDPPPPSPHKLILNTSGEADLTFKKV